MGDDQNTKTRGVNWVLVPVRNGLALTRHAVRTFLRQDIGPVRVLLVDNASMDGTLEWSRSMYPQVVSLRQHPPLSVAASWNKGLNILFDMTEQVLVCNNDVELRPDTYRILAADKSEFTTAVGVDDVSQLEGDFHSRSEHPDFSCFLLRKKVWEKVGKFDEGFAGAFCEDWDYHVRLHQAGIRATCIGIPFYHLGSATIKQLPPEEAAWVAQQAGRNREYFAKKWGVEGGSPEYYSLFAAPIKKPVLDADHAVQNVSQQSL